MSALAPIEARIARRFVTQATGLGYRISVRDDYTGEGEIVVRRSRDIGVIMAALGSTGGDTLTLFDTDDRRLGSLVLIWGNGEDVISDHTDNEEMNALAEQAMD